MKKLKFNLTIFDEKTCKETIQTMKEIFDLLQKDKLSTEDCKELIEQLITQQDSDSGFWFCFKSDYMPSDVRIDFVYTPTYYATAILAYLALKNPDYMKSTDSTFRHAIAKGLNAAVVRNFEGYNYYEIYGFLDTVEIYQKLNIDQFLDEYPDISKTFAELWKKTGGRLVKISTGYGISSPFTDAIELMQGAIELLDERINKNKIFSQILIDMSILPMVVT